MNAELKEQLGRILRLLAITLFSSAIVTNLVSTWSVRYPLLGLAIGLIEATYRTAVPTMSLPRVKSVPAPPPEVPK